MNIVIFLKILSIEERLVDVKSLDIFYDYLDKNKRTIKREEKAVVIFNELTIDQ